MHDMKRVVAGAPLPLTYIPVDADGEPSAVDPGIVTIGVTAADGSEVVAAATATVGTGTDPRTYTLPVTATAVLDQLTVTWTAAAVTVHVTTVDVVGGVYATIAEIRGTEPSLSNSYDDSTATLLRCRDEVETMFERAVNGTVSFVPRFDVARISPAWTDLSLALPHYFIRRIRWTRTWTGNAWTTSDAPELATLAAAGAGVANYATGAAYWPSGTVEVGYEHGLDGPPDDIKRAAILAIRHRNNASKSAIDPRATSFQQVEGGTILFTTPGLGPWVTGIPDVDEPLKWWRQHYPAPGLA